MFYLGAKPRAHISQAFIRSLSDNPKFSCAVMSCWPSEWMWKFLHVAVANINLPAVRCGGGGMAQLWRFCKAMRVLCKLCLHSLLGRFLQVQVTQQWSFGVVRIASAHSVDTQVYLFSIFADFSPAFHRKKWLKNAQQLREKKVCWKSIFNIMCLIKCGHWVFRAGVCFLLRWKVGHY